ncbi:MAG: ABC transporter substrate-binding protein [Planctomycetota bacterium]
MKPFGAVILAAMLGGVAVTIVYEPRSAAQAVAPAPEGTRARNANVFAPGRAPVDAFHPASLAQADGRTAPAPKPAYGGRVIVHTEVMPKGLNYAIENTAYARRILYEVHESLLQQDWEWHDWKPNLAARFAVEDRLVRTDGGVELGAVHDEGAAYRVARSTASGAAVETVVKKSECKSVDRGVVYTFFLRDDVKWHDGHPFDAHDVVFSASLYANPGLATGEKRYQFEKIVRVDQIDARTVRFEYAQPYAVALQTLGDNLTILPSHLYDLADPDNAEHQKRRSADASWKPSAAEQAEYVTKNPHNRDWVGLGPYRVAKWDSEMLEATRFDDYFDETRAGYFDTIRWRHIKDDAVSFQALLAGELDFFTRLSSDDYFGPATEKQQFTDSFYKGYFYSTSFWYVGWNLRRPQLADTAVRQALARLFDFEEFKTGFYKGLAVQVTGSLSIYSTGYDHALPVIPHEPERALELLSAAGWEDRDGDGVRDKDGVPLEIEILLQAGSPVGRQFALKYQEALARAGIRLKLTELDFGTILERRNKREFDALALGWAPPLESDPEQLWHSKQAERTDTSNFIGFADGECDALIEASQIETNPERRALLLKKLQARIYTLQPYLFAYNPPRKFALNKSIRGFQAVHIDPNYVIRRWYYPEGTPGTRPTRLAGR